MIKKLTLSIFVLITLLLFENRALAQPLIINLAGDWSFELDSANVGEEQAWFNKQLTQSIHLPGSTDEGNYGTPHKAGDKLYTGDPEIWQLARKNVYIGKAWYQKKLTLPNNFDKQQVLLSFERCMWQTKLWINGKYVGENHSLCAPHQFDISAFVKSGENTISLQINNAPYVHLGTWSHGYSPGIQSIWNGAVGNIQAEMKSAVFAENLQCYPSLKEKSIRLKTKMVNKLGNVKGTLGIKVYDKQGKTVFTKKESIKLQNPETDFETEIKLSGDILAWDEFDANLYTVEVQTYFKGNRDLRTQKIGFRDFSVENGRLLINGRKTFLRGEHDAGSFPLSAYPSMEKEEWLRIFKIGKEYGLNHWRFHSWCPPEAAFEAADELGIYLQPELSLFSQDWEHTLIGQDTARDEFLFSELKQLLDTYGNHPSFLIMCMGNELRGNASILEKWVEWGKLHDNRHLFVSNANLEAMRKYLPLKGDELQVSHAARVDGKRYERRMGNYFNSEVPNAINDYSHTLQAPYNVLPIVVHELGQWTVYPDFSEIDKYTGVLIPRNMEVFRSRLEQKGMLDLAPNFLQSSLKLSEILYREEVERTLRTPGLGGFQLLDLRDYPAQGSALVGLLNAFWESKGVKAHEFKQSCNDITLLLKTPKYVWLNNEVFNAEIVLPNYGKEDIRNADIEWSVYESGNKVLSGNTKTGLAKQGDVNSCGVVNFSLDKFTKASKLIIKLASPSLNITNQYNVWVYPSTLPDDEHGIIIAREATPELLEQIKKGANVLLVPEKLSDGERTSFTTPFWSTILFDYQPKTLGIYCDPQHKLFKNFPTDGWTDWQWWELTVNSYSARLNQTSRTYRPILQIIDHPVRNDKLGAIVETKIGKGSLLVCTFDIISNPTERPVARQLKYSILQYMKSGDYKPEEVAGIADVFFASEPKQGYRKIEASHDNSEYPVIFAFDGDDRSYWKLEQGDAVKLDIVLLDERYIIGCKLKMDNADDERRFKVFVSNDAKDLGNAIIEGNMRSGIDFEAERWDNGFTIQKGKKGKFIHIVFEKGNYPLHINEFNWIFGD